MNKEILMNKYNSWILILIILALFLQVSVAYSANKLLAWPVKEEVTRMKAKVVLKPHEIRKGNIAISGDLLPRIDGKGKRLPQIAPLNGDTISINLFDDVKYDVKVASVHHNADGTIIVNGMLKHHKMRTVVMTVGLDGYLITVQDMNKALLYRVSGNSSDGFGTVTEIDMRKMPLVIR